MTSCIELHHAIALQDVAENVNAGKAADMTHVRITCSPSPSVKTSTRSRLSETGRSKTKTRAKSAAGRVSRAKITQNYIAAANSPERCIAVLQQSHPLYLRSMV